jgi:hypothetical protein
LTWVILIADNDNKMNKLISSLAAVIAATATILLMPGLSSGQCTKWNYSYCPEIRCDYLEYFGLPQQASQICLTRQNSKIAPGDYYLEPNLEHFMIIPKTKGDIEKFSDYQKLYFQDKYVCDNPESLFNTYLIYGDPSADNGQSLHETPFSDSNRREFFGKFAIDDMPIFLSGWFDKFACLYINIECDSVETAIDRATAILKLKIPLLSKFTKTVFEMKRSDIDIIDSLTSEQGVKSESRKNEYYRAVDSDKLVWYLFKKNVALMVGPNPYSQTIAGVKQYWVVAASYYFNRQYSPSWIAPPQK